MTTTTIDPKDHEIRDGGMLAAVHLVYGNYLGRRTGPATFDPEHCPVCRATPAIADEQEERPPV